MRASRKAKALPSKALVALLLVCGCRPAAPPPGFVIDNVRVIDGSGAPGFEGAVRVVAGRVVVVGAAVRPAAGEPVVDGRGLVLAPGFIDTHSHADEEIFELWQAIPAVSQGITTVVVGQDGGSPHPLGEFFDRLEAEPAAVNVAAYSGHNTLREEVMGDDFRRHATAEETARMGQLLEADLDAGALGLSTGLEYDPGIYSATAEVIALARAAAAAGGRYISHIRSEDRYFFAAVDEVIEIGRETGMPVQISHLKLAMKRLWGRADELIGKLDAARADGVDITADLYPYRYWQSNLMVLLPERDLTDLEEARFALEEIAPAAGMIISRYDPNPDYVGQTLEEIARARNVEAARAYLDMVQKAAAVHDETGEWPDLVIAQSMWPKDIEELFAWPHTNVCTDGGLVDRHPRARGSATRVLGSYVRERGLVSLETAIHKLSGLAAAHAGIRGRGVIRPGAHADLVLFDPETVIDRATPEKPELLSRGIVGVWVNGRRVFESGAATGARPGRVLRREPTP